MASDNIASFNFAFYLRQIIEDGKSSEKLSYAQLKGEDKLDNVSSALNFKFRSYFGISANQQAKYHNLLKSKLMSYYTGAFEGRSLLQHLVFLTLARSCLLSALIDLEDLVALAGSESSLSVLEYCLHSSFERLSELTLMDPKPTSSRWLTKVRLLLALLRSS